MSKEALKPCPFCEGRASLDTVSEGKNWFVRCTFCGAEGGWHATSAGATRRWNWRKSDEERARHAAEVAVLRGALEAIYNEAVFVERTGVRLQFVGWVANKASVALVATPQPDDHTARLERAGWRCRSVESTWYDPITAAHYSLPQAIALHEMRERDALDALRGGEVR